MNAAPDRAHTRLQVRLLGQVVGISARDARQKTAQPPLVPQHEELEGRTIPGRDTPEVRSISYPLVYGALTDAGKQDAQ